MKTTYTLLPFAIFFLLVFEASAKIWRVNNNQGVNADFTTLQAAHDRASSGDTIHVEGSVFPYANIELSKPLILIGPGYFLDENKGLQANTHPANTGLIIFLPGSSGSVVMGLIIHQIHFRTSTISAIRNRVTSALLFNHSSPIANIVISQNYLDHMVAHSSSGVSNLLVSNNYFNNIIELPNTFTGLYQNNIFATNVTVFSSTFTNNIMMGGSFAFNNNTFHHNVSSSSQFGTENSNKANINMGDVFVGPSGNSTDKQWQLKAGSPAKGAGVDGADAGIFGGANPYVLSGIPAVPTIYVYTVPPTGNDSSPLKVTIRVRSNN